MSQVKNNRDLGTFSLLALGGALWGLFAGFLIAIAFLVLNPVFIDSFGALLLWFVLLPLAAGIIAGAGLALLSALLPVSGRSVLGPIPSLGLGLMSLASFAVPAVVLGLGLGLFGSAFASFLLVGGLMLAAGLFCAWFTVFRHRGGDSRRPILASTRNLALAGLVLLALFWPVSSLFRAPSGTGEGLEMLVIGLDGCSPIILDRMTGEGELPAFASIMEKGCYGELTSLTPIFSPMIWASIATGKMPDKHGVRDFLNASYLDIKAKTVWEIFEEKGGKTGLYEWLCTWPPVKLNGFLVPGWLARNSLTYPVELRFIKDIKTAGKTGAEQASRIELGIAVLKAVKHGVRLSSVTNLGTLYVYNGLFKPSRPEIHYKKYLMALAMDADIFEYLLATEKPKYAFYYHQTIDPISHVYWQYHDPTGFSDVTDEEVKHFGKVIDDAYRAMDRSLGHLLAKLGPGTKVVLISDHGFQSIIEGPEHSGLLVSIRADTLLDTLGIDLLEGFHTMSQLFMTAQTQDEDQASQILNQARNKLATYWLPDVDKPLFIPEMIDNPGTKADYVRISLNPDLKDDFYAGRISQDASVVRYEGGECLMGDLVWRKFNSGVHHPEGIIMVEGPGIRSKVRLPAGYASVVDVTPTLLAMAGFPQAHDMDGKVLFDIFEPGTVTEDSLDWVDSYGSGEEKKPIVGQVEDDGGDKGLRDQLKSLGYIDG